MLIAFPSISTSISCDSNSKEKLLHDGQASMELLCWDFFCKLLDFEIPRLTEIVL